MLSIFNLDKFELTLPLQKRSTAGEPHMEFCVSCSSCLAASEGYYCPIPSHLANTNDPPLEEDKPVLQTLLGEAEQELHSIEDQIQMISHRLTVLQRRRKCAKEAVMACKGALSPVRSLPREVLTAIFDVVEPHSFVNLLNHRNIWRASHVCRIWRDASILCSSWTEIDVHYFENMRLQPSVAIRMLQTILDFNFNLSRPVSLTLSISCNNRDSQRFLDVALNHSELWHSASLLLHYKLLSRLQSVHGRVPKLESLKLTVYSHRQGTSSLGTAFQIAPALRELAINNMAILADLPLPWSQITNFDCNESPTNVNVLKKMTKLAHFDGWECVSYGSNSDGLVTFPHLQSLYFGPDHDNSDNTPPQFLSRLVLPALSEIRYLRPRHLTETIKLIERSKCKVTSMVIEEMGFGAEAAVLRFFQYVPHTTRLTVPEYRGSLDTLTNVVRVGSVLPHLKELSFDVYALTDDVLSTVRGLLSILLARSEPLVKVSFASRLNIIRSQVNHAKLLEEFGPRIAIEPLNLTQPCFLSLNA